MVNKNKVIISGIDTSKLPVLTDKQKEELLIKIKQGDKLAKDEFIKGNLRLVLSIVQRFAGRGESMDDLFQVGCIGLIKSAENFDISLGLKFSTYGVPMIIEGGENNVISLATSKSAVAYGIFRCFLFS